MSYQGDCYNILKELLEAIRTGSTKEELAKQFDIQLNSLELPTIGDKIELDTVSKLYQGILDAMEKLGTNSNYFIHLESNPEWIEVAKEGIRCLDVSEDNYTLGDNYAEVSLGLLRDMYEFCTLPLGDSYSISEDDEVRQQIETLLGGM